MTDQQKKAVEEAAEKLAEQDLDTSAWTDHTHDDHCLIRERQNSFQYGAEEVLNNPEKYGLIEISKVLQGLGLKGGDTCKP